MNNRFLLFVFILFNYSVSWSSDIEGFSEPFSGGSRSEGGHNFDRPFDRDKVDHYDAPISLADRLTYIRSKNEAGELVPMNSRMHWHESDWQAIFNRILNENDETLWEHRFKLDTWTNANEQRQYILDYLNQIRTELYDRFTADTLVSIAEIEGAYSLYSRLLSECQYLFNEHSHSVSEGEGTVKSYFEEMLTLVESEAIPFPNSLSEDSPLYAFSTTKQFEEEGIYAFSFVSEDAQASLEEVNESYGLRHPLVGLPLQPLNEYDGLMGQPAAAIHVHDYIHINFSKSHPKTLFALYGMLNDVVRSIHNPTRQLMCHVMLFYNGHESFIGFEKYNDHGDSYMSFLTPNNFHEFCSVPIIGQYETPSDHFNWDPNNQTVQFFLEHGLIERVQESGDDRHSFCRAPMSKLIAFLGLQDGIIQDLKEVIHALCAQNTSSTRKEEDQSVIESFVNQHPYDETTYNKDLELSQYLIKRGIEGVELWTDKGFSVTGLSDWLAEAHRVYIEEVLEPFTQRYQANMVAGNPLEIREHLPRQ